MVSHLLVLIGEILPSLLQGTQCDIFGFSHRHDDGSMLRSIFLLPVSTTSSLLVSSVVLWCWLASHINLSKLGNR